MKKENRTAILYVRIKPSIKKRMVRDAKKLGYSLSEYIDKVLDSNHLDKVWK